MGGGRGGAHGCEALGGFTPDGCLAYSVSSCSERIKESAARIAHTATSSLRLHVFRLECRRQSYDVYQAAVCRGSIYKLKRAVVSLTREIRGRAARSSDVRNPMTPSAADDEGVTGHAEAHA